MGHVIGLWHEQSRSDRNSYVVLNTANIDRPYQPNFDPVTFNAVNIGFYDYSSIMHYGAFGFSVNGFPTLESTPVPGIPLSNPNGYSTGDIDGVNRLYGAAPTQITIDTNPSGLQVKVDGATVTTPLTHLGMGDLGISTRSTCRRRSSRTEVRTGTPLAVGTISRQRLPVKRLPLSRVTVTSAQPATAPSNTYYVANFVPLWPFSKVANSLDSIGTGTIATSPNPATYSPAPGTFYLNRQQVQLTATPGTGSQFYGWGNSNYPLGDNPHTFVATFAENPLYGNFVSANVGLTTFKTNIPGLYYPPASITIDSNGLWVPLTFAAGFDTGWTAGSAHNASAITPSSPVTTNVQYNFLKWADQASSSTTHPTVIQLATGQQTFTANYDNGSFRAIIYSNPACGGSVNGSATINGALDEMLAGGTTSAFTATANSPLVFAGWTGDLVSFGTTATANPTVSAELFATANFNVINSTLTITGFSPLTAQAGNPSGLTLTINGTGFTASTQVFWNSSFRTATYVSSTQLQVALSAADIGTAGGQTVTVQNVATIGGNNCYVFEDAIYNLTAAQVAVPNVVGLTQAAASSSIAGAGLTVGTVTMASSNTVPSGAVISESPAAATLVNPGSSVNLVVSSGPAQVSVPNVVGNTQAAAGTAITGAGLVVGTVTMQSSGTVASGKVVSESPSAGTSVNVGSAVNLVVSTGPSTNSAAFNGVDTATQGTWTGKYGADGYLIANDATSPPAYATVSLAGSTNYTFAASTTDPRALQISSGSSTRIASAYYATSSFTISVNLTDGKKHRVALYLLDWNTTTRAETISILDGVTNVVLDTETFFGFNKGEYAAWIIQGSAKIQVTLTGGSNAVVSGIFFDPPSPIPRAAAYSGLDTLTRGTWTGKYGADGYLIPNDATSPPAYATVSLTGATNYTFAASTSDPRALQVSSGSSTRVASAYYAASSFTINVNLTDGRKHRVALYLLDWNTTLRAETISILDGVTNAVLDTETFSSFNNGAYAAWNIQGNVKIQLTLTGGANAVVSGVFFDPPSAIPNSAAFSGLDTLTQGTWTGKYGVDGYLITNDATSPPAYATVSLTGATNYTFAASTTDPRALQVSSGSSARIASAYYAASSFTINVNLTDGKKHRIALYLLDWNTTARAETISILDGVTNAMLDTETFASFHNGVYAVWNAQGNVRIQVTLTGGANAVVSGIFFDPSSPIPSSVAYSGLDTLTQGTWTGKYGADGYLITNDATSPPAYATVSLTGATNYTFAASTTDPRALQVSSGSSARIASAYYAASSFTINVNLTDGKAHRIALYLLDWNTTTRAETISILDAGTNAVLDTETFASFQNGEYAAWNIQGDVRIQVTLTGGTNPVVSGIFFN